ncbi:MAG: NAD(P)-binding protein, partial [Nakamurella sp.]
MSLPLRVAVIGAGPAGCYAADILCKSDPHATVDIFDQLPSPYGLIRYGVAPDHPRIKGIINSLHQVLSNPRIRFFGNVRIGSAANGSAVNGTAASGTGAKGTEAAAANADENRAAESNASADVVASLPVSKLREFYDAIVVATGATHDRALDLPGIDLPGSYGA